MSIFICDAGNDRIARFTQACVSDLEFGSNGSGDDNFDNLLGCCTNGTYLYVCDSDNDRVKIHALDGTFVDEFGSNGSGDDNFDTPIGICTDGTYLYICDSVNDRIKIHTLAGVFVSEFGTTGSGDDNFNMPYGICTDGTYLYITDLLNHRVKKHTIGGIFSAEWGSGPGAGNDEFNAPQGICTDGTYVYVCDYSNNRVIKFTLAGAYVSKWGTLGSGNSNFTGPIGICTDGVWLYTVDYGNDRFKKYTLDGTFVGAYTEIDDADPVFDGPAGICTDGCTYASTLTDTTFQKNIVLKIGNDYFAEKNVDFGLVPLIVSARLGLISDLSLGEASVDVQEASVSIGSFSFRITDVDGYFTSFVGGTGTGLFGKKIEVWYGRLGVGLGFWNYKKMECGYVTGWRYNAGSWEIDADEITELIQTDCFTQRGVVKTAIDSDDTTISIHGPFDGPATDGYVKIDDEFIKYGTLTMSESNSKPFSGPRDMCVTGGYVYNLDTANSRIVKTDDDGVYVAEAGSLGSGDDNFNEPKGICTDGTYLYVSDTGNNRIKKYNLSLVYQSQFGTSGTGDDNFSGPIGICTDNTYLYICDHGNDRVKKHQLDGTYSGQRAFTFPNYISVNSNKLYISTSKNLVSAYLIYKLNDDMTTPYTFTAVSITYIPQGIYMDGTYLWIVGPHAVHKYTISVLILSLSATYGSYGSGINNFYDPESFCTDGTYFYVADKGNNRVKKITTGGVYVAHWGPGFTGSLNSCTRAQYGSTAAYHDIGAECYLVEHISATKPMEILNKLLISGGGGGAYDVYADGCGIDADLVDSTAILALDTLLGDPTFEFYLYDIGDALTWIQNEILLLTGVRLFLKDGKISACFLNDPTTGSEPSFAEANWVETPEVSADRSFLANNIAVNWDYDQTTGLYDSAKNYISQASIDIYGAKPVEEYKFDAIISPTSFMDTAMSNLVSWLAFPKVKLTGTSHWPVSNTNPGDAVHVTHQYLPIEGSTLGMSNEDMLVLTRNIDASNSKVDWTLIYKQYVGA